MFMRMGKNQIISGQLNWHELKRATQDGEGPIQKLSYETIHEIFSQYVPNYEFTGLDFK